MVTTIVLQSKVTTHTHTQPPLGSLWGCMKPPIKVVMVSLCPSPRNISNGSTHDSIRLSHWYIQVSKVTISHSHMVGAPYLSLFQTSKDFSLSLSSVYFILCANCHSLLHVEALILKAYF